MAQVVDHLSVAELAARYEASEDVTSSRHFQAIFLLAKGHSIREVAEITSFGLRWVAQLLERYNAFGPAALGDLRRDNRSLATVLKPEVLQRLRVRLNQPPPEGGVWTSGKVARWMADELGLETLSSQRGWEALRAAGWSIQKPRPRNPKAATAAEQDAFKKSRRSRRRRSPGPSRRSGRSVRDRRASARTEAGRATRMGADRRAPGRARPSSLPMALCHGVRIPGHRRMLLVCFQRRLQAVLRALLATFAQEAGAGRDRIIVLVLDNAVWHTESNLAVPEGIRLLFLPAYTPELQPAEHLWQTVDELIVNKHIPDLETLEAVVSQRCAQLSNDRKTLNGAVEICHRRPKPIVGRVAASAIPSASRSSFLCALT